MIQTWYAQTLSEYYANIKTIGEMSISSPQSALGEAIEPRLWFRGHERKKYNLIPNIFRSADYRYNNRYTYSNNHLREDYRFQHFMARSYNKLGEIPTSVIEWQQVMQHYGGKTRLMDWSENAMIALLFALEAYVDPKDDKELEQRRMKASPVVWILEPQKLNQAVYNALKRKNTDGEYPLIYNALKGLADESEVRRVSEIIGNELDAHPEIYFSTGNREEGSLNGLISLSALEMMKKSYVGGNLLYILESMELNPFFYLLLRYYSDGLSANQNQLPPLATIHPYYSQRIQTQRGEFTIFPYYIPDSYMQHALDKSINFSPTAMEYMDSCQEFLYRIVIRNPVEVASELLLVGERRSNLYPEVDYLAIDMENGVHHI